MDALRVYKFLRKAFLESEKKWRDLSRLAPVILMQADVDGNVTFVNEFWKQLSGFDKVSALGKGFFECIHPDNRDTIKIEWDYAIKWKKVCFKFIYNN
jgi:PAS domain S-box-containing protein